jgi:AcrR family transcriptional regulator
MTPRTYRLGRRQAGADRTRANVVAAARRLLMKQGGPDVFSLDAVAKRAGVTRLTVYNQFGSRSGLLEAVYDDLARRGRIGERLSAAFQLSDAEGCLNAAVAAFVEFWNAERAALRRLRSMAVLDREFRGATQRDERRRQAIRTVIRRLEAECGKPFVDPESKVNVLTMLTSFETFDALAPSNPDVSAITALLQELAHAALESR